MRSTHSRSIGIHPPALQRLDELDLAAPLTEEGVAVRTGVGMVAGRAIGSLSFEALPPPFNYVLAVPQHVTEAHLEKLFGELGGTIHRGHEVIDLRQDQSSVSITTVFEKETVHWSAEWMVACDGRRSSIRDLLGIELQGRSYQDHYVMGDFPDTTSFGNEAAIYLDQAGVIECFPLPGRVRRWVARVDHPVSSSDDEIDTLIQAVADRTSIDLHAEQCLMHSAFTAERHEASRFFVGRVALAGDAAHVISPIGGQGMNLGWMDADWLAAWFDRGTPASELSRYERTRKRSFRKAARRSELNMFMGRSGHLFPLRRILARAIMSRALQNTFVRLFTMRGV